jgi:hypothetical protein
MCGFETGADYKKPGVADFAKLPPGMRLDCANRVKYGSECKCCSDIASVADNGFGGAKRRFSLLHKGLAASIEVNC